MKSGDTAAAGRWLRTLGAPRRATAGAGIAGRALVWNELKRASDRAVLELVVLP